MYNFNYRNKGLQILLSNSQAGPGRKIKQEQEEISRNHVQAFFPGSVQYVVTEWDYSSVLTECPKDFSF